MTASIGLSKFAKSANVPIIFITAQSINNDGVRALAAGASDFIEKPFAMDYLIAKIQLLLKEKAIPSSTMVEAGDFRLNSLTNTVKYKDVSVRLTPTEAIILKILFKSPHEIVSKKKFIKFLWENDQFINENILDVNISRLRQKLSQLDDQKHIVTIRGKGYQMDKLKEAIKVSIPYIITYLILILIFAFFVYLYNLKWVLVLAFVQFTWPFGLLLIFVAEYRYFLRQKKATPS